MDSNASSNNTIIDSSKECYDIISKEYDHVIERGNKLDNKVSIILAFTGIVFGFSLELLDIREMLSMPMDKYVFNGILIYILFSIITVTLYVVAICFFLNILLPRNFSRFDANSLLENQLQKNRHDVVYNYVSIKYCVSTKENNKVITKQYRKLSVGIILDIIAIALSVILIFTKHIIL